MHKNVKPYFAVQYKGLAGALLNPLAIAIPVSLSAVPDGRRRGRKLPAAAGGIAGRRKKRSGKVQKTALFTSSNRSTSARQGCRRSEWGVWGRGRGNYHAADPDRSPSRASWGCVRFCCCSFHNLRR